ncbi:MAG: cysteine desulfurase family protein [Planctomycetota bacterium]|nr:cysteine desulfurase family protein [Planctomycetota bacterium]
MQPVLLDLAATSPLDPRVRECLIQHLDEVHGNPSSRHALGTRARQVVEHARRRVARCLGAEPKGIVFTSGGTESNNLGLLGSVRNRKPGRILVGPTEHASVRVAAAQLANEGFVVETLRLKRDGQLDLDHATERMGEDVVLVAQMLVSNELGTRYPVQRLARLARARCGRVHVHCDGVQALGKIDLDLEELGVDSLALSGHKVHGPKGMGALALGKNSQTKPLLFGGSQEEGLRPGTENVPSIAAFGLAVDLAHEGQADFNKTAEICQRDLEEALTNVSLMHQNSMDCARILQAGERVNSICAVHLPGPPAEVWQHHLEEYGVFIGVGSACQSASKVVSPVLLALGLDADSARQIARFSFSRETTPIDIGIAASALRKVSKSLKDLS